MIYLIIKCLYICSAKKSEKVDKMSIFKGLALGLNTSQIRNKYVALKEYLCGVNIGFLKFLRAL